MKTVAIHHTIIPVETLQIVLTVKRSKNPFQTVVQPLLLFLKTLSSPIKTMKILQLNTIITILQHITIVISSDFSQSTPVLSRAKRLSYNCSTGNKCQRQARDI